MSELTEAMLDELSREHDGREGLSAIPMSADTIIALIAPCGGEGGAGK